MQPMSTKTLRWLGVVSPLVLWAFLAVLRVYLAPFTTTLFEVALELTIVTVAGALFSNWVANRFDAHEAHNFVVVNKDDAQAHGC